MHVGHVVGVAWVWVGCGVGVVWAWHGCGVGVAWVWGGRRHGGGCWAGGVGYTLGLQSCEMQSRFCHQRWGLRVSEAKQVATSRSNNKDNNQQPNTQQQFRGKRLAPTDKSVKLRMNLSGS